MSEPLTAGDRKPSCELVEFLDRYHRGEVPLVVSQCMERMTSLPEKFFLVSNPGYSSMKHDFVVWKKVMGR